MSDFETARDLGKILAEIQHLHAADLAMTEEVSQLRAQLNGLDSRIDRLSAKLDGLIAQVGKLEPSVETLISNRARLGYMLAGMGVILTPIAALIATFWQSILKFASFLWRTN